jgi:hypothetical protein
LTCDEEWTTIVTDERGCENTRQQQAEEAKEKKKMNNTITLHGQPFTKRTLRGRFEFMKDIKPFYKVLSGPWNGAVDLLEVKRPLVGGAMNHQEVTFDFWFGEGYEGSEEDQVKDVEAFVREVVETADAWVCHDGTTPGGMELHVFTGSLKWLEDYDGKRDGPWEDVRPYANELRESA